MEVQHYDGAWWVTNMPDDEPPCGPYDTRAEAESDRVGMARYFRDGDKYWTVQEG